MKVFVAKGSQNRDENRDDKGPQGQINAHCNQTSSRLYNDHHNTARNVGY